MSPLGTGPRWVFLNLLVGVDDDSQAGVLGWLLWAPLNVNERLTLMSPAIPCTWGGVKLCENNGLSPPFFTSLSWLDCFWRSASAWHKMNLTSAAYSPHLCSTFNGHSAGVSGRSLSRHFSMRVNRPVRPIAWARAITTS